MSTKKHSPQPKPKRSEALSGRLSKSASELSCTAPTSPPPRARSAHHHTPLSVVHRTQHFFTNLKSRWQRSRSRERCHHTTFSLAPDSSGTDYGADQSSEQSTPANSPRHRIRTVAPTAVVGRGAKIGPAAAIAAGATIGSGASIGARSTVAAGAVIGSEVSLDPDVVIEAGAIIGNDASIETGAVISAQAIVGQGATVKRGVVVGQRDIIAAGEVRSA